MLQSQTRLLHRLVKYGAQFKMLNKKNYRLEFRSLSSRRSGSSIVCCNCGNQVQLQARSTNHRASLVLVQQKVGMSMSMSTKVFSDEGQESNEVPEALLEMEHEYGIGIDDHHLKIQLYPNDPDPILAELCQANTLQEIFDIVDSIAPEVKNEKHSSQALISIWDLQKLLYKICIGFDPEKDDENRFMFIEKVREHPTFRDGIVDHVISNYRLLEDEPLAASLLSLKRLLYGMDSMVCQTLLQEALKRKATLALPAVSRITVCLRSESNALVFNDFLPCLYNHVLQMDSDFSIRLVSISARNANPVLSNRFVQVYRQQIAKLLRANQITFETVTLCKILLCLFETSRVIDDPQRKFPDSSSCSQLLREVGIRLSDRTSDMGILEIVNLQRYLEFGPQEPRTLIDSLMKKISRLIEEEEDTPTLDLIHCVAPSVRSIPARRQLAVFVRDYLDLYKTFDNAASSISKILRCVKLNDMELYDQFWIKAEECVRLNSNDTKKVLRYAQDYMSFVRMNSHTYRNHTFETTTKQLFHMYIRNYQNSSQPSMIVPGAAARIFAFIIAFGTPQEPVFYDAEIMSLLRDRFADNLKVTDLITLARGIETSLNLQMNNRRRYRSKYFDEILDLISMVDGLLKNKLFGSPVGDAVPDLSPQELNLICKTQIALKRNSNDDSPIYHEAMRRLSVACENSELLNSRLCKDITVTLLQSNYNLPSLFSKIKDYIFTYSDVVSPDLVAKFIYLAYSLGYDSKSSDDVNFFQTCYSVIERYWTSLGALELLQAMQSLCFYRALDVSLVQNVFSIQFLDQVDEELTMSSATNPSNPMKVRVSFMELNRAVCIDLPEASIPWFHEKFCEDIRTTDSPKPNQINSEVYSTLSELLNNPNYIQRNSYSSYSYPIDFLIEFDKKGRPIKKMPQKRSLFSFKKTTPIPETEVGDKVAILVLPGRSFTKHIRSLRGYSKLKHRHLEMLGYRVVTVDPYHWNSMYMSEPSVKSDYLERCIYLKPDHSSKSGQFVVE